MRDIALTLLLTLAPIAIIGTITLLIGGMKINNETVKIFMLEATPIIFIFVFELILPILYPKLLKAVDLEDQRLTTTLNELFDRAGVKRAKLYVQPTKARKYANALVMGLVKPKVIVTDYYLENAEPEEIAAIIAHEVGHLKQKHLLKRLLYIVAGICGIYLIGFLMEWYENYSGREINVVLGLSILLLPTILYMSVGLLRYYRKQERAADEFAIKIGIKPEVMIAALLMLASLNHMAAKMKKLDEKFQTYPSMAKRIKHIEEISGKKMDTLPGNRETEVSS